MAAARIDTYDARRDLIAPKPLLRGWSHLLCFGVSLVFGTVLITSAPAGQRWSATIYVLMLSGLFGTSALYHRGTWNPRTRRLLQRADHAMIFLLIAGTATPVFAATMPAHAPTVLSLLWGLTAAALLTHLAWMNAPEWLVGGTFILLGCIGVAALPAVWVGAGIVAFAMMLGGGVLYIAGATLYHWRRPDPWPDVFGYHEVFHLFVCAAAALHYATISDLIL